MRFLRALVLALCLSPTPAHAQSDEIVNVISHVAHHYGLPVERLFCIARLESTFRPLVTSVSGHKGLWQWEDSTWRWASAEAGFAGSSPYELVPSTFVAGWLMAQNGWHHWSVSRYC